MLAGLSLAGQAKSDKQSKIENAMAAAPEAISAKATIRDWPAKKGGKMPVLRQGSNGWTCLPDMPQTQGNDPMCLDKTWLAWAEAFTNGTKPQVKHLGFGYMLQGGPSGSNLEPTATKPSANNEWIEKEVPHVMILVPDKSLLAGVSTDPNNGGPWVMWRNSPYVHIMAPVSSSGEH